MTGSPLRIALLSGWYYPDSVGGTESYVRSLAHDLRDAGHVVGIAAPAPDALASRYDYDGAEVFRFPIDPRPSRALVRNEVPPPHLARFDQWLAEWRPDVVHMHSITGTLGFQHALCARRRGLPLLLTAHVPGITCPRGTLLRWGEVQCDGAFAPIRCGACCLNERGLPKSLAWAVSTISATPLFSGVPGRAGTMLQYAHGLKRNHDRTLRVLALARTIVVVSEWLREVLQLNGVPAERLALVRHGLSREYLSGYDPALRPRDVLTIGFLGRFDPVKGVHVLLEAFRALPAELPVRLELRGVTAERDREYGMRLRRLADGDRRITFAGPLPADERHQVLSRWHLLAVPSVWLESGPLVVLEAFAAGMPVLGSDLGGIRELVRHGRSGVLVRPGSIPEWTAALLGLVARFRGGDWAWSLPRVRSSGEVSEQMLSLYRNALRPSNERAGSRPVVIEQNVAGARDGIHVQARHAT